MLRRVVMMLVASVLVASARAQDDEVVVPVGRLAAVTIGDAGKLTDWKIIGRTKDAKGFSIIDTFREYDPDTTKLRLRVMGYEPTTVYLVSTVEGKIRYTVIRVGEGPGPGPGPDPKPPDPKPPEPTPTPIPGPGFRVLIVYESSSVKTPTQQAIMDGQAVRAYLNSKCAKGTDGKTPEWRIWDKDINTANASKLWQDAMKRPRNSLPWIVIGSDKGGFEGPLPDNIEKTMELLVKYGG